MSRFEVPLTNVVEQLKGYVRPAKMLSAVLRYEKYTLNTPNIF